MIASEFYSASDPTIEEAADDDLEVFIDEEDSDEVLEDDEDEEDVTLDDEDEEDETEAD